MKSFKLDPKSAGNYSVENDDNVCTLYSTTASEADIGHMKIVPSLSSCAGKKMRFQALISSKSVFRAGLWLTANTRLWHLTDGMYERYLENNTEWTQACCVLDLPDDSEYVSYGVWLAGKGSISIKNFEFGEVGEETSATVTTFYDRVAENRWVPRV